MRIENNNINNLTKVESKENQLNNVVKDDKQNINEKPAAIFEKSNEKEIAKKDNLYDAKTIAKLKAQTEQNKLMVFDLIRKAIGKQTDVVSFLELGDIKEVPESVKLEAQELISEDGEFGIEKTSQRIIDFAIAISGDNPEKANILRDAIEKGFKEAEKMFGGELPQISQDTYTRTMEKFDAWANPKIIETE